MLFTVAYGFFYSMNQSQTYYQRAIDQNNQLNTQQLQEQLTVTIYVNATTVYASLNNTGTTATIVGYQILSVSSNMSNGVLLYNKTGTETNPILVIAQGQSGNLPGGYTCSSCSNGHFLVKVITGRGNVFTGAYPAPIPSQSLNALSSGAIGDLYLSFSTFSYYNVTSHTATPSCPASGTAVPGGIASGYCLSSSSGLSGFTMPSAVATSNSIAFSVQMTDYNPSQLNITLDQYSLLSQYLIHGTTVSPFIFYVASNYSTTILQTFTPVTLKYGVPTLLLYAASAPDCSSSSGPFCSGPWTSSNPLTVKGSCSGNNGECPGYTAPLFLVSHGCKAMQYTTCNYKTSNYGQNSPYVTMLYY